MELNNLAKEASRGCLFFSPNKYHMLNISSQPCRASEDIGRFRYDAYNFPVLNEAWVKVIILRAPVRVEDMQERD